MKLFLVSLSYAAIIGIKPDGIKVFNSRNVGASFLFGMFFISTTVFVLTSANTFFEYAKAIFVWLTLLAVYIGFFNMILQSKDLLQLLLKTEKCIDNRKHIKVSHKRDLVM